VREPPDNGRGRGLAQHPGHRPVVVPTTTDSRRVARERIRAIEQRRAICREAERLMPLARYYAGPPLLAVPIGDYYVRGRWAS
jgi:hypothetical protein